MALDDLINKIEEIALAVLRRRFNQEEKEKLRKAGVNLRTAAKYMDASPFFYNLDGVIALIKNSVNAAKAGRYRKLIDDNEDKRRFWHYDKGELLESHELRPGDRTFLICDLIKQDVSEDELEEAIKRFGCAGVDFFSMKGIPLKTAMNYKEGAEKSIPHLYEAGCMPEQANKFVPWFYAHSVKKNGKLLSCATVFAKLECPPETANKYAGIGLRDVVADLTYRAGIDPEKLTRAQIQEINRLSHTEDVIDFSISEISSGVAGVVGRTNLVRSIPEQFGRAEPEPAEPRVWKLGPDLRHEYKIYRLVQKANNNRLENVVRILGIKEGIILDLERIRGKTLSRILEEGNLSLEKSMRYCSQILNGIKEIHKAGVYHKDIHDRNILINDENDNAVIIDLGQADQNPYEIKEGNPRYGGNNDLVSLGIIMYKMITGHNLFNDETIGLTATRKPEVKMERERAYENPEVLAEYMQKVRDNVEENTAGLIIKLLDRDLWTQPDFGEVEEMQKEFGRYVNGA
jgi:hypothetical protein